MKIEGELLKKIQESYTNERAAKAVCADLTQQCFELYKKVTVQRRDVVIEVGRTQKLPLDGTWWVTEDGEVLHKVTEETPNPMEVQ